VKSIATSFAFSILLTLLPVTSVLAAEPKLSRAPAGFGVLFETSNGTRIDTFNGRVTKDLVRDPDTTIALKLTPAELDTLHSAVVHLRLLELPEPHPRLARGTRSPNEGVKLQVRTPSGTRTFSWHTKHLPHPDDAAEWGRLHEFIGLLRRLPQNHRAYRALPRPRGAYL
jgi:hypothetical protein